MNNTKMRKKKTFPRAEYLKIKEENAVKLEEILTSEWYREAVDPNTPMFPTSGKISSNIIQLEKGTFKFIKEHGTLREYVKENNLSQHQYSGIYNNLNKTSQSAYGYVWMWEEDYKKFLEENEHKD